jgi:hypothetical protein
MYENWVAKNLRKYLEGKSYGYIKPEDEVYPKRENLALRVSDQIASYAHLLLNQQMNDTTGEASRLQEVEEAERIAIKSLIGALKTATEEHLGTSITNGTLSSPGFFNSLQMQQIHKAANVSSLHTLPCPSWQGNFTTENSAYAAAVAQRQSQAQRFSYDQAQEECAISSSPANSIFGPFGIEEVIVVEYTGKILLVSVFKLYIGSQTARPHK